MFRLFYLCVANRQREACDGDRLRSRNDHVIERQISTAARCRDGSLQVTSCSIRGIDPEMGSRAGSIRACILPGTSEGF